jgi:hypothetical protein
VERLKNNRGVKDLEHKRPATSLCRWAFYYLDSAAFLSLNSALIWANVSLSVISFNAVSASALAPVIRAWSPLGEAAASLNGTVCGIRSLAPILI